MNPLLDTFRCGDGEALVTFIYDESTPAEREAITEHLAQCTACAEELALLGATRDQLAAWTPPDQALGFRLTRADAVAAPEPPVEKPSGTVLRPAAWWHRPLPAWAQMAAAAVIFVSGLALGGAWSTSRVATEAAATGTPAPVATATPVVTQQDLAAIEQQLRAEIAQVKSTAPAAGGGETRALMTRVTQLIAASEDRQMKELDFRTSVLANDLANARRIDNANVEQRLRGTTAIVNRNQQTINSMMNSLAQPVGFTPTYSPYVP